MAPLGLLWASVAVFRDSAGTAFKHRFVVDAVPEQAHRDPGDPEPPNPKRLLQGPPKAQKDSFKAPEHAS